MGGGCLLPARLGSTMESCRRAMATSLDYPTLTLSLTLTLTFAPT